MIIFGDKNSGQYVEIERDENYHGIIHWVNYPREIIYYCDTHDEYVYNHCVDVYQMFFKTCRDIEHARKILDHMATKEKIVRTVEQVRKLKNKAFDNLRDADYWFGVFDALRWVLGDKVEEFEDVSTD